MKTYIMIDVESNGPIPGDYSMTSLGAVIVDENLDKIFLVNIKPITDNYQAERNRFVDTKNAVDAKEAMTEFKEWINKNVKNKPVFVSDNNGYDWMFVCWYFWHFIGENPLGYNSQNLNSFYKGIEKDLEANVEALRSRKLTHEALEDALDNAKIMLSLINN